LANLLRRVSHVGMKKLILTLAAVALCQPATSTLVNAAPPPRPAQAAATDDWAYEIVEQLTREVGARQAGTDAEQKARDWAVKKLNAMGFSNVREESFMMPTWVRGAEKASVIGRLTMNLSITALGNSGSTGAKPLTGEIAYFRTFDALVDADPVAIKGKIVFVDHDMTRTQDGSSYGYFGRARRQGPNVAAKKGALAIIVRSAGTSEHDHPHTGNTNFDAGVTPIPAAAISNASADSFVAAFVNSPRESTWKLDKTSKGNKTKLRDYKLQIYTPPVEVQMVLTPRNLGQQKSGNVIAELTGSNPALPPILIACHLDSWDLATGAIDDASGCGIITAAASYMKGQNTRTIRILWAGAEEVGIWGGKAYGEKYADQPHALAMESDFGADRVWAVDFNLPESAKALQERIARRLALIGITPRKEKAGGGADIGPIIAKQGLGVIDLQQDGTRYFDIHHNATDTIAVIDKAQLRQNVVAWTTVLEEVANYTGELKPEKTP
jgi:carboxypeptidase Q